MLKPVSVSEDAPDAYRDDPRWKLALDVVAGPNFSRSVLLSRFLLYVVAETLEGRQHSISEHKIGVAVFGRQAHYRTDEDNIVRNYARQLRRRLTDHFAAEGGRAQMRIEIPIGGYVPSFPIAPSPGRSEPEHPQFETPQYAAASALRAWPAARALKYLAAREIWTRRGTFAVLLLVLIALGTGWAAVYRYFMHPRNRDEMQVLWRNVLPESRTTYIVPADVGLNLLEDLTHRSVPLADYINGAYATISTSTVAGHAGEDLHTQQYTDFVSAETMSGIMRRPEYDPQRVHALFPRDLRLTDLKTANALIIGSSTSNPWASVIDVESNFGIVTSPDMAGAKIVNRHPLAGEHPVYTSNWGEHSHETFALVLYRPNLSRSGNILLLEGLDVAGTQGAAEALLQSDLIAPILSRAVRPDGTLRSFEILLRTTSIHSSAEGTEIVASRVE